MRSAAQDALTTHDHLTEVGAREPDSDRQSEAWLQWHDTQYKPAFATWSFAMNALEAKGYTGGRHPFNFRPYCEEILKRRAREAQDSRMS